MLNRRIVLCGALSAAALMDIGRTRAASVLKISHQFPGGTRESGDFRDRLCRKFADELTKRTNGALGVEIYPNSSLVKTNAQFDAVRKGAIDMTLYPLAYAGGEVPEVNITLMPCIVSSYVEAAAWKKAPIGEELAKLLADKGVIIVSWIWQAGGLASRGARLLTPEDAKGMKVRGGSREMDLMFKAAGAAVMSMPSNELYAAMQTGAVDAVVTSSTSLISFHMEELTKNFTGGNGRSYWFMFEPLLMSKTNFDALPSDQQQAIMAIGAEMESFAEENAKADDRAVVEIYKAAGAAIHPFDDAVLTQWKEIARASAWKDFADKSASNARFLKLAEAVTAPVQ
jgi:TRAP-type transport system periplasmic protein